MTSRTFEPRVDVTMLSPNKSQRLMWPPKLIVIHSTEGHNYAGTQDLRALGSWFQNPSSRVSCHVATDAEGYSGRYCEDRDKAWHCMNYNSASLGIEQVGTSSQLSWPDAQVKETAKWCAFWSRTYGIPLRKGWCVGGRVLRSGIVRHSELGSAGGNHGDPGRGYPMRQMLRYARWYKKHGWVN